MRSSAEIAPSRSPSCVARPAKRKSTSRSAGFFSVSWNAASYCCFSSDDGTAGAWAKACFMLTPPAQSPPAQRMTTRPSHFARRKLPPLPQGSPLDQLPASTDHTTDAEAVGLEQTVDVCLYWDTAIRGGGVWLSSHQPAARHK